MYAFVIITNNINFSNAVKDYFTSMSPINYNNTKVFVYGTDVSSEKDIIKDLKKIMDTNTKISNCFVFSDFGNSLFSSKDLEQNIKNTFYSKGSLIETGYLAFKLINGSAPIESIMLAINRTIAK